MYEPAVMLESQLPAVYVKKEQKRIRIDPTVGKHAVTWLLFLREHKNSLLGT